MRKFFEVIAAALPAMIGIGAAVAIAKTNDRRRKPLGDGSATPRPPGLAPKRNAMAYEETLLPIEPDDDDPWRPRRDEDDGCLILGRHHHRYGDPYRVCLTHNQNQRLFRGKFERQQKLGCGVFACAYSSPAKSRVVKFTRDAQDVAALIEAQKTGVVPKVYAVYRLAQDGRTIPERDPFTMRKSEARDVPVYAMVVERLRTIPSSEREAVDDELLRVREGVVEGGMSPNDFCDSQEDPEIPGNTGCGDIQLYTLRAYEKLKHAGIEWKDMHAGNIGFDRNGRLKVLDLGLTQTELKKEPEVLEGRQRAARNLLEGVGVSPL